MKFEGSENVRKAYHLLQAPDWKLEKVNEATGDRIQSVQRREVGKIFRLTAQIQYPAKELLLKLFDDFDQLPTWNPTVLQSKILKRIDRNTDITYQVSAPAGGGIVASRDFVILRCWKAMCNGMMVDDDGTIIGGSVSRLRDESMSQSQPVLVSPSAPSIRKSASVDELNDIEEVRNKTTLFSLSKSLGAKRFADDRDADETFRSANLGHSGDTSQEPDVFVDARETQSISTIGSPNKSAFDLDADRLYIMNSVSIKYDRMPRSKFVR